MPKLTLTFTDAQLHTLQTELAQFARIATALDPGFVAPSLEEFTAAKLFGGTGLTANEPIRSNVVLDSQSSEQQTIDIIASLLRSARLFNFAWVCANDIGSSDMARNAKQLAECIASDFGINQQHSLALADALRDRAVSIETAARNYFPCMPYKLVDSLLARESSAYKSIFDSTKAGPADVLRWEILVGLVAEAGALSSAEVAERRDRIKEFRPELVEHKTDDWLGKIRETVSRMTGLQIKRPADINLHAPTPAPATPLPSTN
jgi:hypothetical protein